MTEDAGITARGAQGLRFGDAVAADLGLEVVDVGSGAATVRLVVAPRMVNGLGTTHGGYVFLLADTACACNGGGVPRTQPGDGA